MLLNRTLYFVFVTLLASSPLLSIVISYLSGRALSLWAFMWVGVSLSLPLSLLGARAFGARTYYGYWAYLESFPGNTKARILTAWATMSALTVVGGIMALGNWHPPF